jgi:hypothetical protein
MVKEQGSKIAKALHEAQGLMTGVKKDSKNPFYKSTYSSLGSVFEAVMAPFQACDIAVTQVMDVTEGGHMLLITKLIHVSGEMIESKMILPSITDPQKIGGAITYYKRYSLQSIAGVPSTDDDGQEAVKAVRIEEFIKERTANDPISAVDLQKLKAHPNFCPELERDILDKLKLESLSQIKTINAKQVCDHVRKWKSLDSKENNNG